MLQRLHMDSQPDSMDFIGSIAKNMFSEGGTNWGRITSLVAFGAAVCSSLKECQREECVEAVAQQISSYLISEQHHWLQKNNGWIQWECRKKIAHPENCWSLRNHRAAKNKTESKMEARDYSQSHGSPEKRGLGLVRWNSMGKLKTDFSCDPDGPVKLHSDEKSEERFSHQVT